jgi:hypothetical protein
MQKNELIMMARRIASHMVTSRNGLKRALTEQWSSKDILNSAKDIAKSLNDVFSDFKRLQNSQPRSPINRHSKASWVI